MKSAKTKPRYNVQLKSISAYVAGHVSLRGRASVHMRLNEFTHVIDADSALALAKSIVEQAEAAIRMAKTWEAVVSAYEARLGAAKEGTP